MVYCESFSAPMTLVQRSISHAPTTDTIIRLTVDPHAGVSDLSPTTAVISIPGSKEMDISWVPEITTAITHLRDVLGEATYESLARMGAAMTTAEMVAYAYDQIDQARAELERPS